MAEFVKQSRDESGKVARVTLNRPELHNAFNDQMIVELADAFRTLGADPSVRAIILDAEGKSFCAGADLNWMKRMVDYTFEENVQDARALAEMLQTIRDCPKPVIARVHGAAFGGGVGLVSACDMAVALKDATFCLSEVKLGLLPAVISSFVLEKIGPTQARRYFLTAEKFSGKKARKIGLISESVEDVEQLDAMIVEMVESLLQNAPGAVASCKTLITNVVGFDWSRAMDISTRMIAERRISEEGQDGMKAFLEKREPAWRQPAAVTGG